MRYVSTRSKPGATGSGGGLAFDEVLLGGLAPDGGLYVPDAVPDLPQGRLVDADRPDYVALATRLMQPYVGAQSARTTSRRSSLTPTALSSIPTCARW